LRLAVIAAEKVRAALRQKQGGLGDGASIETLRIAAEQRAAADTLLRALMAEAQKKNNGPQGSP
jgi:hypothetical protein